MSGLREYISEAISSGKRKSSKYSLPEDISKITLDDLTDWLDDNGYTSVVGKLKPFSSIVDMYSGTPLYSVQIPIGGSPHFKALVACKDDKSFYIFYFDKGGAYIVRAVECDMYGDVLDDIMNVVYKRFVSSVNEAISSGRNTRNSKDLEYLKKLGFKGLTSEFEHMDFRDATEMNDDELTELLEFVENEIENSNG